MLKEKNYQKALELVEASPNPKKMDISAQAELLVNYKHAKAEYEAQAELTKKHYKEVYEPMCAEKARLEIRMHELKIRLDQLGAGDVEATKLFAAVLKKLG